MKKSIIILVTSIMLLGSAQTTNAQLSSLNQTPATFIGVGTGINETGIVGFAVEPMVAKRLSLLGTAGIGTWGYKLSAGAQFYLSQSGFGSSMSIGYAYATGINNFSYKLEVEPSGDEETVDMTLKGAGTVNVAYAYNFRVSGKNKLVLTAGVAIPTSPEPYTIDSQNVELTNDAKNFLDFMAPGGLILGVKYMFGIR